jgi:hypothetical protein
MTSSPATAISFEHRRYFGRPSCPRCGELCTACDCSEYVNGTIRNRWSCDGCNHQFESTISIGSNRFYLSQAATD